MSQNEHDLRIQEIGTGKELYLPLLLEADPNVKMIDRYLHIGCLYGLFDNETLLGNAVVVKHNGSGFCEIKNIVIAPNCRGRGYGTAFVLYLLGVWSRTCDTMLVGTSESGRGFYEKLGFAYMHTVPDFFTKNYPEPIYDNGVMRRDMLYFGLELPRQPDWRDEFLFGDV